MSIKPKYVCLDTETTGLDDRINEIIQFAGVLLDENLNELREVNIYAHPSKILPTDAAAFAINGYSFQEWEARGAIEQVDLVGKLREFFTGSNRIITIAHNAAFDVGFLAQTFARAGASKEFDNYLSYHKLDTVSLALFYDLENHQARASSYKLTTLCERYGIDVERAHDARSDVHACLALLKKYLTATKTATALPPPPPSQSRLLVDDGGVWKFKFGRYAGMTLTEVASKDLGYLGWVLRLPDLTDAQRKAVRAVKH